MTSTYGPVPCRSWSEVGEAPALVLVWRMLVCSLHGYGLVSATWYGVGMSAFLVMFQPATSSSWTGLCLLSRIWCGSLPGHGLCSTLDIGTLWTSTSLERGATSSSLPVTSLCPCWTSDSLAWSSVVYTLQCFSWCLRMDSGDIPGISVYC